MENMDSRLWNGLMICGFFKVFGFLSTTLFTLLKFRFLNSSFSLWLNRSISVYSWEILEFHETSQFLLKTSSTGISIMNLKEFYDFLVWKSRSILNSLYCWVLNGSWTMVEILMEVVMNFVYTQLIFFKTIE